MENLNEEQGLDILGFLLFLKKKIILVCVVAVLCAIGGYFGTEVFMTPEYTASTRIYVLSRQNEDKVLSSDYQISNFLVRDCTELITGRNVTEKVVSELGLKISAGAVSGMIQVTSPEETRIIQINVTDTDPQRAADIANSVRKIASEQIKEIMDADAVNLIYEATTPKGPSGPNSTKNMILAAFLGLAAVVCLLGVIFVLDDTIRTEEDVEKYLGLGTLGVIPMTSALSSTQEKPAAKKRGSQRSNAKKK